MHKPPEHPVAIRILTRILEYVGALLLFAMMTLTFVDVIARYFFNRSITGGFEITEVMLATLIFCGLPLVTLRHGHITVDLIESVLSEKVRRLRNLFVFALTAATLLFLSYRLWLKGLDFYAYNDQTAVLYIPLAPVCFAMSVLTFISAGIALYYAANRNDASTKPTSAEQPR
ncbi:hypothetical protein AB833_07650 [Chromatiales bacterium (ex Bugula neritina AB1)]|nr:hypothetical protein AB833_07650 [Chromatiales bacterium (ex Bugula neritina AB1)]